MELDRGTKADEGAKPCTAVRNTAHAVIATKHVEFIIVAVVRLLQYAPAVVWAYSIERNE
jgi:hypothetical protein